jgi:hypothetical protein
VFLTAIGQKPTILRRDLTPNLIISTLNTRMKNRASSSSALSFADLNEITFIYIGRKLGEFCVPNDIVVEGSKTVNSLYRLSLLIY